MNRQARRGIGLGLCLAALGNGIGLLQPVRDPPLYWALGGYVLGGASLAAVIWPPERTIPRTIAAALVRLHDAGVTSRNLRTSLAAGAAGGLALGMPSLGLLLLPAEELPGAARFGHMPPRETLKFILWKLLVLTALSEELAFRGVLQRQLGSGLRPRQAVLLSSLFFALWHGTFNVHTLSAMGVTGRLRFGLASMLQMLAVFSGGLVFGVIRARWGSLAGPVLAHWLADLLLNARFLLRLENEPREGRGADGAAAETRDQAKARLDGS